MDETHLALLVEPTRRSIVALLAERPRRAMSLGDTLGLGSTAIARHLRVLREAGIVLDGRVARDGRVRLYTLHPRRARAVLAWLATTGASGTQSLASGRWPKHTVVVEMGQERFAIVSDDEARLIPAQELVAVPLGARDIVGVIEVDGTVVAVVDLARRLGLEPPAGRADEPGWVVVVPSSGGPIGMRVCSAVAAGQLRAVEVRAMPAGATSTRAAGLLGVARVGGRLMVLVDAARLMD